LIKKMAASVSRGDELQFTIIPHELTKETQQSLLTYPNKFLLGFVTHNEETGERKFTYTEAGCFSETTSHWSLTILKEFPYLEQTGSWLVFNCRPQKTKNEFNRIVSNLELHIDNWDIWTVSGKDGKVAVVTEWEIY